jgi:hypothetical protein
MCRVFTVAGATVQSNYSIAIWDCDLHCFGGGVTFQVIPPSLLRARGAITARPIRALAVGASTDTHSRHHPEGDQQAGRSALYHFEADPARQIAILNTLLFLPLQ